MAPVLNPQMAAVLARLREASAGQPEKTALPVAEGRRRFRAERMAFNAGGPTMAATRDLVVPGPGPREGVPVRLYRPRNAPEPAPVIVYAHGGGWVFGDLDSHDKVTRCLADAAGAVVAAVDYALSPEHRFPVAVEEVAAVMAHLAAHAAEYGLDPEGVTAAGDSAGANLVLAAALRRRDAGAPPPAALLLFYGAFDTDFETESYTAFGGGEYILSRSMMMAFWDHYAPDPERRAHPLARLVAADLAGLPFVHLSVAGVDPLRDDSLRLAERLRACGVPHRLLVHDGLCHAFLHYVEEIDAARAALTAAADDALPGRKA